MESKVPRVRRLSTIGPPLHHQWSYVMGLCLIAQLVGASCPSPCKCSPDGTVVDCSSRNLLRVPKNLPNTTVILDLSNNGFLNIDDGAFAGLNNLLLANLSHCLIVSVHDYALRNCCQALETLDLTMNELEYLPLSLFDGLYSLRKLYLMANKFEVIPEIGGTGGRSLTELDLSGNFQIKWLIFDNSVSLGALQVFKISTCRIEVVFTGSLSTLTNLTVLDVSTNPLGGQGLLQLFTELRSLTKLRVLDISDVRIGDRLNSSTFSTLGNSSIEVLDISNNFLARIDMETFRNLPRLRRLDLSSNLLTWIDSTAIHKLEMLDVLLLRGNKLNRLPSIPMSISQMDLSRNLFDNGIFYTPLNRLTKLTWLDLSHNKLDQVYAINELFNLEWLDVSHNEVTSIDWSSLPKNSTLTFLNVSFNRIGKLDLSYGRNLELLVTLDLSNNFLVRTSKEPFEGMAAIKNLNLSNTNLGPCFNSGLGFDNIFSTIVSLEHLDMSKNSLIELPSNMFRNLTMLNRLELSGNSLISWNSSHLFSETSSLIDLSLESNHISVLTAESFISIPKLRVVNLKSNPLSCGCDNVWFRRFINQTNLRLVDLQHYTCQSPATYTDKPFMEFDPSKLDCTGPPILLVSVTLGGAFLIGVLVLSLGYRYRWRIRFRLYMVKRRLAIQHRPGYEPLDGQGFLYSAYISYCRTDECKAEIMDKLLPLVEECAPADADGQLVVHIDEKFLPNRSTMANIVDAVESSAVFVVFLCPHYSSSRLCELELELAFTHQIESHPNGSRQPCFVIAADELSPKCVPRLLTPALESGEYCRWTADEASKRRVCRVLRDRMGLATIPTPTPFC